MKYKIVKKYGKWSDTERYYIYRRFLWLFWIDVGYEYTQEKAEKTIEILKKWDSCKRVPPETIGYY